MRTTRTLLALAAASALVAGTVAPASAKSSFSVKESGDFISMDLSGPESSDIIPGNYLVAGLDVFGGYAMGGGAAFDCADGQDPLEGDECTFVAEIGFDGPVVTTKGKGKDAGTTVTGDLYAYTWIYDEETGEGFTEELGVLPLDATLNPYGKKLSSRGSDTYRDNTGYSFTARWAQTAQAATVSGTLGDLELAGEGWVGTYRNMYTERQR